MTTESKTMNKKPGMTAEENTESPNSRKVRESFAKYYQNVYQYLDEKIKNICEEMSKIPQYKRIEEDSELKPRRIINETSQHQGEKNRTSEISRCSKGTNGNTKANTT